MRDLPPVIRIEPASSCNLRCRHCPTGVAEMARGVMGPSTIDRVVEQVAANTPPFRVAVLYHGGEPLLNPRFFELARRIKDLGIPFVKTVSNGMRLTPDVDEAFLAGGLDAVEFSLDGDSPELNDAVRTRADFHVVVENVRRLAQRVLQTDSPLRIEIATTQFQTLETIANGATAPVPQHLAAAFEGLPVTFKPTWAVQWPSGDHDADRFDAHLVPRDDSPTTCGLLDETITIRANGEVVPCCYDLTSMEVLGNIHTESLAEIWRGSAYESLRRRFAATDYPELCAGCAWVTGPRYLVPRQEQLLPLVSVSGQHREAPLSTVPDRA